MIVQSFQDFNHQLTQLKLRLFYLFPSHILRKSNNKLPNQDMERHSSEKKVTLFLPTLQ